MNVHLRASFKKSCVDVSKLHFQLLTYSMCHCARVCCVHECTVCEGDRVLACSCMQKQKLFSLVVIRPELLFKPNKHYVAELEKKDYLGKAKVPNPSSFQSFI